MIPRPLSAIGPEDIRSLIENEVRESRTIDYKQALYATADKLSLLKDVSALANTDGGDIVCGIAERLEGGKTTGVPEKVIGLAGFNEDQETRRLDDTLRNGLARRPLQDGRLPRRPRLGHPRRAKLQRPPSGRERRTTVLREGRYGELRAEHRRVAATLLEIN
jgi:hypothetical protein